MALLQNNLVRFGGTLLFAALYSLLRSTEYSIFVKPLPVLWWMLIIIVSDRRDGGNWLIASLALAAFGDIILDIGHEWLGVGSIVFMVSTLILAIAFYVRYRRSDKYVKTILLLMPIAFAAIVLFGFMFPYLGDNNSAGAVLLIISALLLWRSSIGLLTRHDFESPLNFKIIGFLGCCGIVANYVLYAVDLNVTSVPRDLVIQLYYWGQAFAAWSFTKR